MKSQGPKNESIAELATKSVNRISKDDVGRVDIVGQVGVKQGWQLRFERCNHVLHLCCGGRGHF